MAGGFRFRLDAVERLRRQDRDGKRRKVAEAARDVQHVENRIALLTQQLADTVDGTRRQRQAQLLDVVSLKRQQFYRGELNRRIEESNKGLLERLAVLEAERRTLTESSRRLKVIEKLRERFRARHEEKMRRMERRATDEVGVQSYVRRLALRGQALQEGV
ncbi:MAG: flagellar export protein FliJ [Planctomycetes bacterium]|nr:flagellar export protein FliJ [Planctomycetota bacterium]